MGIYLACQRGKHPACNDTRRCSCDCHQSTALNTSIDAVRKRLMTYYLLGSFFADEMERASQDEAREREALQSG